MWSLLFCAGDGAAGAASETSGVTLSVVLTGEIPEAAWVPRSALPGGEGRLAMPLSEFCLVGPKGGGKLARVRPLLEDPP